MPDPDAAVRALDGVRVHLPLLLAISANSPFWRGRYTSLASARTALRARLPQRALPRRFGSFAAYVETIEALVRSRIIAAPGAIRWDAYLRPDHGSIAVSLMDAQTRVADITGLTALVQCLVRLYAEREAAQPSIIPEILSENRSRAARLGMRARLVDPAGAFSEPARDVLTDLVDGCAPLARELDCGRELACVLRTAADPGYARQQSAASAGLAALVAQLSSAFGESGLRQAVA